jgi:hypothetical protein
MDILSLLREMSPDQKEALDAILEFDGSLQDTLTQLQTLRNWSPRSYQLPLWNYRTPRFFSIISSSYPRKLTLEKLMEC